MPSYERSGERRNQLSRFTSSPKCQAREDIQNGAISINRDKVTEVNYIIFDHDLLKGNLRSLFK